MKVRVTEADRQKAREVYRLFKSKPYSKNIASEFALAHLAAVLRENEIRSVLEFGAGIGTMTYMLLTELPDAHIEATEHLEKCLGALRQNLPEALLSRLHLHAERPPEVTGKFDLIVVDGHIVADPALLNPGTIIFSEGQRTPARREIDEALSRCGLFCRHVPYLRRQFKLIWLRPRRVRRPGLAGGSLVWRPTRFRVPRPKLKRIKGCWIGRVQKVA